LCALSAGASSPALRFRQGRLRTRANVRAAARGMKFSRRQRQVKGECEPRFPRRLFKRTMELDRIGRIVLEHTIQFFDVTREIGLNRLAKPRFDLAVGDFHPGTSSKPD